MATADYLVPAAGPGPFTNGSGEDIILAPPPVALANVSDILGECRKGDILCQRVDLTDNQIKTTMWICAVVGVVSLAVFCLLRRAVQTYTTRLRCGTVWILPPKINTTGLQYLWSWMWVLVKTSDAELVQSCGLDALVYSRILTMGVQIFLAGTILVMIIVMPVVRSGNRVETEHAMNASVQLSNFNKLTASNIPKGSAAYWALVVFIMLFTGITCFILAIYYKANVILRQQYMSGGEGLLNAWNNRTSSEQTEGDQTVGQFLASTLNNIVNPTAQMFLGNQELSDGSARPGSANRRQSGTGSIADGESLTDAQAVQTFKSSITANPDNQLRPLRLSLRGPNNAPVKFDLEAQIHNRRQLGLVTRPVNQEIVPSIGLPTIPEASDSLNLHKSTHQFGQFSSRRASGNGEKQIDALPTPGHRRRTSELSREMLSAMGLTPRHELAEMEKIDETRSFGPRSSSARTSQDRLLDGKKTKEILQLVVLDDQAHGLDGKYGSRISKYERDAPVMESDQDVFFKWWKAEESSKPLDQKDRILNPGKPNVSLRKIINPQNPDGTRNTDSVVNAQNYVVLVTDVPDIVKGKKRRSKRERRSGLHWLAWYRLVGLIQNGILMRKDKDRKTGDLIIPTNKYLNETPLTARTRKNSVTELPGSCSGSPLKAGSGSPHKPGVPETAERCKAWVDSGANSDAGDSDTFDHPLKERKVTVHGQRVGLSLEIDNCFDKQLINSLSDLVSPKSQTNIHALDEAASESDAPPEYEEDEIEDGEDLVTRTFRRLFPDSFEGVIPIRNHKAVDLAIHKCNNVYIKLQEAEAAFQKSGMKDRPMGYPLRGSLWNPVNWFKKGPEEDLIDFYAKKIRILENQILVEKRAVLNQRSKTAFFVLFNSQQDAAMAAQSKIHAESGHSFKTQAAPGPEEVNWQALWTNWIWREIRGLVSLVMIAAVLIIPIGLFSGGLNQLTASICDPNPDNKLFSEEFCKKSSFTRSLVTGVVPPTILIIYQFVFMPNFLYRIAQFQRNSYSMSQLDRKIGVLFFAYDVFNVFLGAMLGGSIFSQIGILWKHPDRIAGVIGTAMPAASNFFINYVIVQAFLSQFLRLLFPHLGVFPAFWRACGLGKPQTPIQKFNAHSVHSIRYGREIGSVMLIYLVGLVYSATSPLIMPFTLLFSIAAWIFWRYNMLYVSERCYESGGRIWELTFQCMMWILFIAELFTGTVLLANRAYPQAAVMWIFITPLLYKFARFCDLRYANAIRHMPLEVAVSQPRALVPVGMYIPPAMRDGCEGWHPEIGKAWESFGMPQYGIGWNETKKAPKAANQ